MSSMRIATSAFGPTSMARQQVAEVMQDFVEPHGDRRQEIVFIGQSLNCEALSKALDACLCCERDLRQASVTAWPQSTSYAHLHQPSFVAHKLEPAGALNSLDVSQKHMRSAPYGIASQYFGSTRTGLSGLKHVNKLTQLVLHPQDFMCLVVQEAARPLCGVARAGHNGGRSQL